MLKLWKVNAKAGDATVKYPFAPFPTNKDMRGKPEHNAELCIACGACGVACPADAIRMDTDLAADTITWSIDYGRCIFCGRCEEACPMEAIKLTEEFELAVMSKDDLTSKSVYTLEHCSRCGKPFAPASCASRVPTTARTSRKKRSSTWSRSRTTCSTRKSA